VVLVWVSAAEFCEAMPGYVDYFDEFPADFKNRVIEIRSQINVAQIVAASWLIVLILMGIASTWLKGRGHVTCHYVHLFCFDLPHRGRISDWSDVQ
jgi:hypothetical protein